MPKPYMPLPTMSFQHGQQALRSHRNNKQLFFYPMNTVRPTVSASRNQTTQQQRMPLTQPGPLRENVSRGVQPTTGHQLTKAIYTTSGQSVNHNNNNGKAAVGTLQCGQRTSGEYTQLEATVSNYYCNMLNFYANGANKRETQQQQVLPTPTTTPTPVTTTAMSRKSPRIELNAYTSPKPIFLPTIYNYPAETTTKHTNNAVETLIKTTTTPPSFTRSDGHEHNFFTIEDAITSAPPQNYVFNNPYEALSHARKRKELQSKQKRTNDFDIESEKNSIFVNFFNDIIETTTERMNFNRTRFRGPTAYSRYRDEEFNRNHDSLHTETTTERLNFNRTGFLGAAAYSRYKDDWRNRNHDSFHTETTTERPNFNRTGFHGTATNSRYGDEIKNRNHDSFHTETTTERLNFNRNGHHSPAAYSKYRDEEIYMSHDSLLQANNPLADLYGHTHNIDGQWQHIHATSSKDLRSDKTTTTASWPDLYDVISGKKMAITEVSKTTATPISTTQYEEPKTEKTTTQSASEMPIVTTAVSVSTTTRNKVKTTRFKHPFYGRSTPAYKTLKIPGSSLTALKNSTLPSSTPASIKKKSHKYQRQYKPKKGKKLFKSLLSATSSPFTTVQSTASTTIATTTKEAHTSKKQSHRTVTGSTPTEASTTKPSKRHSERPLAKQQSRTTQRSKGPKRPEKERNGTTPKPRSNKNRRRIFTSSTTPNSHVTSSVSFTTPSTAPITLPSYTATTTKSTTRKTSRDSKAKMHNSKTSTKMTPNEVNDYTSAGSKQSSRNVKPTSSRDSGIPPLPIEIYFKNSQNTHI